MTEPPGAPDQTQELLKDPEHLMVLRGVISSSHASSKEGGDWRPEVVRSWEAVGEEGLLPSSSLVPSLLKSVAQCSS